MIYTKQNPPPTELHLKLREEFKKEFPNAFGGSIRCPNKKCRSLPKDQELRNHDLIWHDGDVYCTLCGSYVRMWDAG